MGQKITKADLGRLAGVSRMGATKAANGPLSDAVSDGFIDLSHALVIEWLASKNVNPPFVLPTVQKTVKKAALKKKPVTKKKAKKSKKNERKAPKREKSAPKSKKAAPKVKKELPEPQTIGGYDIKDLEHLTVREVVMMYGSIDGFKRFVESLKNIADYKNQELKIQQQRGEVISKEKVAGTIFPLIDMAFTRLVSDVPTALSKQVIARVESGGETMAIDVEKIIRDANSSAIKNVKASVLRLNIFEESGA
jgi:hypothetical protein